ncbi:MAG TPA: DUF1552 domain-containing protein [Polyangiaceae bacterium]|nr:DUF1552 domain-containing protein [Polyangiaceae bacterium]
MNRVALNRRRFLKLVGASALTYPFLRGVPSFAAGNNGGTDPPYLVLLFTANGCIRYRWGAQGPAPTSLAPTATAVTNGPLMFRETLSAFTKAGPSGQADLTKYVTVLDGLFNKAALGGTHEPGMSGLWTGLKGNADGSLVTKGPSIDQAIASQLNAGTPYPSIGMIVQSSADFFQQRSYDNRMLYDLSGNWFDPIATSPAATVSQLFPQMTSGMSSGPDKKTFIRQQVWNHVNSDLTSLQKRLCNEDRIQLQNLQSLWNQVLAQLQAAQMQAASCTRPSADTSSVDAGAGANADPFPAYAAVMPNILAMTLACNLTHVASLQYSQALSPVIHHWLGSSQTDTHHNYSHATPGSFYALTGSYPWPMVADVYTTEPASIASMYPQQLVDIETWYAQQVANLAYTFSQIGPSGSTLLDRSVICWGSEIDMGAAHNHDDTPFVLIGGGAGKLKATQTGGMLVRFPLYGTAMQAPSGQQFYGIRNHNDLLVTLAQIMGVSTAQLQTAYGGAWDTFNSYVTGPITEILA